MWIDVVELMKRISMCNEISNAMGTQFLGSYRSGEMMGRQPSRGVALSLPKGFVGACGDEGIFV